ncbi:MAG: ComEC/Rec2 family competence protein, partial [Planctomycetota bacterium]
LTGDAFPEDIETAARVVSAADGDLALPIDLLKLSHHGGQKNTSAALLQSLACKRYLVSSSGIQHAHPNPESIGRILVHGRRRGRPELFFNYESPASEVWADRKLRRDHDYVVQYPDGSAGGVTVELA